MDNWITSPNQDVLNRRQMLSLTGMGLGSLALGSIFGNTAQAAPANPLLPKAPHFPAKAKHVIHIFLNGGPSHVDTFDPKPKLQEWAGKEIPVKLKTERPTGVALPSPYKFQQYGQSGIEVSEIFSNLGECVDDMCFIRSMHANVPNHEPSLLLMNCGEARLPRPSLGSWLVYGLGTENQNLPSFISMCPGGYPIQESQNWQSGFLPGVFQGTYVDTKNTDLEKLIANVRNQRMDHNAQVRQLELLRQLNAQHQAERGSDPQLESRIQSFELAFRMQTEAAEAFDVSREPKHILDMYGEGTQARQILVARRLVERGVRFVQVWHGQGQPWDNHDDIEVNHRRLAKQCDQAIAALLKDLKQCGLLEETLVLCSGEFGRTPTVEMPKEGSNAGKINGRDHNHYGFTAWMAGGGVKGGHVHGATDEFGFAAVEDKVHVHDLHATIMKLMGFDHEKLTYRYAGRDFRLTDIHGHVVEDIIA
ncbi:DUF1501 domain-containing protein [Blastopirellula sp. JC732]|uniref:DUF1501 domain-containing protein n=1 Tax=Blastopirellula sediminis TaxID=2894196 RepID=A0A9X1MT42_9BACT|nr:DUF1501 domain-containing protein [Blastopirellula sediminis]MCC9605103.1 DUF1501 domain-containing protein [Blastopirellula sediminis]MCC9631597.1 DUF1501 domain-containing protein [Blastopirellula sediminis]